MANRHQEKLGFSVIMQYISYKGKIMMLPGCFMCFTKRLQTICLTIYYLLTVVLGNLRLINKKETE